MQKIYRALKWITSLQYFKHLNILKGISLKLMASEGDNIIKYAVDLPRLHSRSQDYWKNATDTFLAPTEYYIKQQSELEKCTTELLTENQEVLDVGCGNGRFTLFYAKHCKHVIGVDLSENLIASARQMAATENITNVKYICSDSSTEEIGPEFDVVSCMGVTSTLVEEAAFIGFTKKLRAWTKPGGFLILKESLSLLTDEISEDSTSGYIANYRDYNRYKKNFVALVFEFLNEIQLAEFSGKVNKLFILKLPREDS